MDEMMGLVRLLLVDNAEGVPFVLLGNDSEKPASS